MVKFVRWIFALGKIFRVKTPCYARVRYCIGLSLSRERGRESIFRESLCGLVTKRRAFFRDAADYQFYSHAMNAENSVSGWDHATKEQRRVSRKIFKIRHQIRRLREDEATRGELFAIGTRNSLVFRACISGTNDEERKMKIKKKKRRRVSYGETDPQSLHPSLRFYL